jgi:hypothetical protein
MFVQDADTTCLRQGDVLKDILYPLLSSQEVAVLGRLTEAQDSPPALSAITRLHRNDPNWLTAQIPVRLSYCCVASQCCDLEPRHGKIRMPAFVLARLIQVPAQIMTDPQRLESLRSNKDPRIPGDPGFLNLFHIPAHDLLGGVEWVADFNQLLSIPGSEFPGVVANKILQMDSRSRVKFKIKFAASVSRLTDEERAAGLDSPWLLPA